MIENIFKQNVNSNDEYREVLLARRVMWFVILIMGALTVAFALVITLLELTPIPDYMKGFYVGFGTAVSCVSIMILLKIKKVLNDEKLMKAERLKNYDERNISIYQKAIAASTFATGIICYAIMLVVGAFNPLVTKILCASVMLYLLLFLCCYHYYEKKM